MQVREEFKVRSDSSVPFILKAVYPPSGIVAGAYALRVAEVNKESHSYNMRLIRKTICMCEIQIRRKILQVGVRMRRRIDISRNFRDHFIV